MKGLVTGVKEDKSYNEDKFWWIYFKLEDGSSAKTRAFPVNSGKPIINFKRWKPVIEKVQKGAKVFLDGLVWYKEKKRIIDADSNFKIVEAQNGKA